MDRRIILQGLDIRTKYKYVKFLESTKTGAIGNASKNALVINFKPCRKSSDIISKGIIPIEDVTLESSDYIEIVNSYFRINYFFFRKIVPQEFTFSQYIVEDIDNFLLYKNSSELRILIPSKRLNDLKGYIKAVERSHMLEYIKAYDCAFLANVPSTLLADDNLCINSTSTTAVKTSESYTQYILSGIDILYSYLDKLGSILSGYGLELLGYPIDENSTSTNYVRWKLTDKDKHIQRKTVQDPLHHAVQCKADLSFELCATDLEVFEDFVFKYQHLRLVSNFTEFYTSDTLGNEWLSSVYYEPISTEFTTDLTTDSSGNYTYSTTFACSIYYYIVEDYQAYRVLGSISSLTSDSTTYVTI